MAFDLKEILKGLKTAVGKGKNKVKAYVSNEFPKRLDAMAQKIHPDQELDLTDKLTELYYGILLVCKKKPLFRRQAVRQFHEWLSKVQKREEFFLSGNMTRIIELASEGRTKEIEDVRLAILSDNLIREAAKDSYLEAIRAYYECKKKKSWYILEFCGRDMDFKLKRNGLRDYLYKNRDWKNIVSNLFEQLRSKSPQLNLVIASAVVQVLEHKGTDEDIMKDIIMFIVTKGLFEKGNNKELLRNIAGSAHFEKYYEIAEEISHKKPDYASLYKAFIEKLLEIPDPKTIRKLLEQIRLALLRERDKKIDELREEILSLRNKISDKFWEEYKKERVKETTNRKIAEALEYSSAESTRVTNSLLGLIWNVNEEMKDLQSKTSGAEALDRIRRACENVLQQFGVREEERKELEEPFNSLKHISVGKGVEEGQMVKIIRPAVVREYDGHWTIIKKAIVTSKGVREND